MPAKKKTKKKTNHKPTSAAIKKRVRAICARIDRIADDLKTLFPDFKRLHAEDRQDIYDMLEDSSDNTAALLDKYYYSLPEDMREAEPEPPRTSGSVDIFGPIVGAFGIANILGEMARKAGGPESKDPEWPGEIDPDAIDAEYKRIEPPKDHD